MVRWHQSPAGSGGHDLQRLPYGRSGGAPLMAYQRGNEVAYLSTEPATGPLMNSSTVFRKVAIEIGLAM